MESQSGVSLLFRRMKSSQQLYLFIVLIVMCVVSAFLTPVFFTFKNIINLMVQATMSAICGLGICMLLLVGELDLSIGSMMGFCGVLVVQIINSTHSVFIGILMGVAIGAAVGLVNATLVVKLHISAFIGTLGMMSILRGAILVFTQAKSVQNLVSGFDFLGMGYVGPIPFQVILLVILTALIFFLLNYTPFGRKMYAVGSNKNAAMLSGISVSKVKYLVFIMSGMLTAVAAMVMASRLSSGQPNAGIGFELNVISAVILGGVSMTGGRGKLSGALVGILILNILNNVLVLLNVSSFYQTIARGVILLIAVYFDEGRRLSLEKNLIASE